MNSRKVHASRRGEDLKKKIREPKKKKKASIFRRGNVRPFLIKLRSQPSRDGPKNYLFTQEGGQRDFWGAGRESQETIDVLCDEKNPWRKRRTFVRGKTLSTTKELLFNPQKGDSRQDLRRHSTTRSEVLARAIED